MLPVGQRLRRRDEFAGAIRSGHRAGRGCLVVHLGVSDQAARASSRAGFVVPRAVGNAVTRNRVRRRLRHLVRDRLAGLPPGTDLVVRVNPGADRRSYQELAADLDAALARGLTRVRRKGDGVTEPTASGGEAG